MKTDKNPKENLKVLSCKREHIHLRRGTRDIPRSNAFPQSPISGNRWPNKRSKDFLRSGSVLEPVCEPLRFSADEESCKHFPRHSRPAPPPQRSAGAAQPRITTSEKACVTLSAACVCAWVCALLLAGRGSL